jgi:hypothetical protein
MQMGGGLKRSTDVPKAKPVNLVAAVDSIRLAGGGLRQAAAFCARTRTVAIALDSETEVPEPGAPVRLVDEGGVLRVMGDSRLLGNVSGPADGALLGCLHLGFELSGEVEMVDHKAKTARLKIMGRRAEAA